MPTPFQTSRRVEFGDTDMAGILHFAMFFRYMEAAETDFLLSRGLSVIWHKDDVWYSFPRVSAACDYARPARFGETIAITVTVEKVGRSSVTYRFDFTRGADSLAVGRITTVFVCKSAAQAMKSLQIPDEIRTILEA